MSKFYTFIISLCICFLSLEESWGQCPTLSRYEVEYDQLQKENNGILTFFFNKNSEPTLKPDDYEYNLWDKNRGVYIYSPSKLDAGFYVDRNIKVSIGPYGKIEFRNVPPGSSYRLVVSSPECKNIYGPEEGIIVESDR